MILVLNHLVFFLFISTNGPDLIYPFRISDSECSVQLDKVWVFSNSVYNF